MDKNKNMRQKHENSLGADEADTGQVHRWPKEGKSAQEHRKENTAENSKPLNNKPACPRNINDYQLRYATL